MLVNGLCTALILCMVSCGRKWKKPTEVDFRFEVIKSASNLDYLEFNSGEISIDHFSFEGKRKQGEDVVFENDLADNYVDVDANTVAQPVQYDIPQGTYTDIKVNIRIKATATSDDAIVLNGTYFGDNDQIVTVIFRFGEDVNIATKAKPKDGGSNIVLVADQFKEVVITIDLTHWFNIISDAMLEGADYFEIDDSWTILIDEVHNNHLYELIISRLDEGVETTFY